MDSPLCKREEIIEAGIQYLCREREREGGRGREGGREGGRERGREKERENLAIPEFSSKQITHNSSNIWVTHGTT